jgi:hypothetical protein
MSRNPTTLQLRYLQTLLEMGVNQNTTIVFPLPIDLLHAFVRDGKNPPPPPAPPIDPADMPPPISPEDVPPPPDVRDLEDPGEPPPPQ